jgi:lambda repressor-like predicted transcriptional regulator
LWKTILVEITMLVVLLAACRYAPNKAQTAGLIRQEVAKRMAETGDVAEAGIDLDAILDSALEAPKPKGRPKTKTEQLRERRQKLLALQAKGYTELELAQMTGVSKDTLRKALKPPKATKTKKVSHAAHAAQPSSKPKTVQSTVRTPKTVGANDGEPQFPTNARF